MTVVCFDEMSACNTDALVLAYKFTELLKNEMTEKQYNEMKLLNAKEANKNICHSHDYCDANQVMLDAFNAVFERDVDFDSDADTELINKAWSLAK